MTHWSDYIKDYCDGIAELTLHMQECSDLELAKLVRQDWPDDDVEELLADIHQTREHLFGYDPYSDPNFSEDFCE